MIIRKKGAIEIVVMMVMMVSLIILSCKQEKSSDNISIESKQEILEKNKFVERIDTCGLMMLYPHFSKIDLVYETMPQKSDDSVLLVAEAAYTRDTLKVFKHERIAGDHVSGGRRYKGYPCKNNTGAFVYYNNKWKFCYETYTNELDSAAQNGGMGFSQEMLIHLGEKCKTVRNDDSINIYRSLCEYKNKLYVVESLDSISLKEFKQRLMDIGVKEAIYLDMGNGWNYSWYRTNDSIVELHEKSHDHCTNWIVFYK